jgi:hypothetical protein
MHAVLRLSLWAAAAALFAGLSGTVLSVRGETLAHEVKKLLNECDRAAALEVEESANRSLDRQKREVTADLIAGRVSLAEAAEALHEAEVAIHGDFRMVRQAHRHVPEEEAAYCHALVLARSHLARPPDQAAPVLARLRAEYEARFHHPPVPAR